MHISEGVLTAPVLGAGFALAAAGTALGLRRLPAEKLMTAALLSSAFFTASLIHVNLGPASVHLVLNGLLGAILGWAAFPAILVGLTLQALFFQFGGFTALGVNTCIMAVPAVTAFLIFRPLLLKNPRRSAVAGFACGAVSIFLAASLAGLALALSGEAFVPAAWALIAGNTPVMILEGLVTAFAVGFLARVRPELLSETF